VELTEAEIREQWVSDLPLPSAATMGNPTVFRWGGLPGGRVTMRISLFDRHPSARYEIEAVSKGGRPISVVTNAEDADTFVRRFARFKGETFACPDGTHPGDVKAPSGRPRNSSRRLMATTNPLASMDPFALLGMLAARRLANRRPIAV
jgi:hypothetical protein